MKVKKQTAVDELKSWDKDLPFGAKAKLAKSLRENRHNIQTVFRGMASEKLTLRVWKRAQRLFPDVAKPKQKMAE